MSRDPFTIDTGGNGRLRIKKRKSEWIDESYVAGTSGNEYLSSNFETNKLRLIIAFSLVVVGILFLRTGYLQIIQGQEHRTAAEENRIRIKEIKAPRGLIYDSRGNVLARNIPNFVLKFTPADLPIEETDRIILIKKVAGILSIEPSEIQNIIESEPIYSYQLSVIKDHISYEQATLLKIEIANLPGITLETSSFREYTNGEVFAHILGYMGKVTERELELKQEYSYDDYVGKVGIELGYDDRLRGVSGKKEIEVDTFGKESKTISEIKPIPGDNITLSIDSELQEIFFNATLEAMAPQSVSGAAVIAIDPRDGSILSLVSNPSFDSNALTLGLSPDEYDQLISNPNKPLFNRAISGEYPSGSTIKPLIALAGLEEGIISPSTSFTSVGGIEIGQWFFPDWKAGGHGVTDVKKAIAESVNTFFYFVGGGDNETIAGLGVDRIKNYLELFGLNEILGVDIPGEADGFLPSKEWKETEKGERWYIGDTYHLSIGQGDLLVTPLQVASYTAAIANGGTLYKPHLVKSFSDPQGTVIGTTDPEIIRENFINISHINVVKEGLRQAVTSGSAIKLANMPIEIACKTGTAQFGNEGKTHAWFTCFAPYDNPEIVITVLIEQGGEGHVAALPIAQEGLKYWIENR